MNERRKQARKSTSDYFLVYDWETEELIGRVMNLTTEGTMLMSETPIEVPVTFHCKMVMPAMIGTRRFITFDIESIWCTQNRLCEWYETGYRFVNVAQEDLEIIEEIISDWDIKSDNGYIKVSPSNR